jgi:hypothetical protein
MTEMTKEERVLCTLSREEPDRVPLYDLVDNVRVLEHYAGTSLTLENAAEVIPAALNRCLDTTRVWLPSAPGQRVDERGFTHERVDWFNEWQIAAPFDDTPSALAFLKADIERLEAGEPDRSQERLRELLEWKRRYGDVVIPAGTAGEALQDAYITLGLDRFVYLQIEAPELVARWIAALHQQTLRRLEAEAAFRQVSPVAWIFADLAYKGRLIFSPHYMVDQGVFRRIAEICDVFHSHDLKVIFHSDGFIQPIIRDLIAAGVDALAPIEIAAGLNLADLKAEFGSQVAFVGGVDVNILESGSVDDVRQLVRQALADAGRGGGFILGSSSEELFEALPPENIIAMFETAWEYGRYPGVNSL